MSRKPKVQLKFTGSDRIRGFTFRIIVEPGYVIGSFGRRGDKRTIEFDVDEVT